MMSQGDDVATKVILSLASLIIFMLIFTLSLYIWHIRKKRKYSHRYVQIGTDQVDSNIAIKKKLQLSFDGDEQGVESIQDNEETLSESGNRTPKTPDTPATPSSLQAPYSWNPANRLSSSFNRSFSSPVEKVGHSEQEDDLWRSTVQKSAMMQFLNTKPRIDRKISNCANGKIKLTLSYNREKENELYVKIIDFIDLPLYRESGISNPFVKVYLYPQTAHTYQNETNKGFRVEVLSFPSDSSCTFSDCPFNMLCGSALKFVILDYDRFSRIEFVADCVIMLDEVSLEGETITRHLSLRKTNPNKDLGSLLISSCYQPATSRMNIIVLKASALPTTPSGNSPDHFVKITLMRGSTVLDKKRTRVVKRSVCPVFNERIIFPVDTTSMRGLVIVFDVIRYDSKIKQEKIGSVLLGNHAVQRQVTPHEIQHFNETLHSPQRQLAEWHQLLL